MRPGRRRAILGALTAVLVSSPAVASATGASALTIGLPAIEAKLPKVEVSLGPVHAGTPETTVTVPSVNVTTPSSGASSGGAGSGGGSGGGGGGVVAEVPVNVPGSPSKEQGSVTPGGESASAPAGGGKAATSTTAGGSSTPAAATSTPASNGGGGRTPAAAHPRAHHGGSTTSHARAHTPTGSTVPSTTTPTTSGTGSRDPQPIGDGSAAKRPSGNPLAAIGGHLPLPLPVPDWSKPIILFLLLLALGLAARARISSRRATRLELQRASLLSDLHAMQVALVPGVPEVLAALGVSVAYRPADGAAAGGDFYDVFELRPGRVAVILGDVCGHGREALERAALTRYTVRAYLQAGLEPRAALALAGQALADREAHFATVAVGVFDSETGRLTYACAGHPAPIVLGPGASPPLEVCCSPPVGWGIPTGRRQSRIPLPPGSAVCFFTDGLTEARCEGGLLGTQRLGELLAALGPNPSADRLVERVTEVAGSTPDDMAACILTPHGAAADVDRVEELEFDRRDLEKGGLVRFLVECELGEARAAELAGAADRALAAAETAVLQVEFEHGEARARVLDADPAPRSGSSGSSAGRGERLPAPTPVHA